MGWAPRDLPVTLPPEVASGRKISEALGRPGWGAAMAELRVSEPLTATQAADLPDGASILVTWSGGNGPHRYTAGRPGRAPPRHGVCPDGVGGGERLLRLG